MLMSVFVQKNNCLEGFMHVTCTVDFWCHFFSTEIHCYKIYRHVTVLLPVNTSHFYICGELQTTSEPLPAYGIIITTTTAGTSSFNPVFTFLPLSRNIFCCISAAAIRIDSLMTLFLFLKLPLPQCSLKYKIRIEVGLKILTKDEISWCSASISKQEEEMLRILVKYGVRSGKTANLGLEVDGLTFHPYHSDIIQRLRQLTLDWYHHEAKAGNKIQIRHDTDLYV